MGFRATFVNLGVEAEGNTTLSVAQQLAPLPNDRTTKASGQRTGTADGQYVLPFRQARQHEMGFGTVAR